MFKLKPIYVEAKIDTEMEKLWQVTQVPELHQQWDLRFSQIHYLPKVKEEDPQQFLYRTKIGLGIDIAGTGESIQEISSERERISSLRFWSDHPLSFIKEGSGYWKYKQEEQGITFLTLYSYQTRFGFVGKIIDKLLFRPMLGWATAWSFASMKLWLEKEIHPTLSFQRALIHGLAAICLALIWLYQGIVPKLLFPESGELEMVVSSPFFNGYEQGMVYAFGIAEILFGIAILIFSKHKVIYLLQIVGLLLLTLGTIWQPVVFIQPFNPVTLNLAMLVLASIAFLTLKDLPSAAHCFRKQRRKSS